MARTPGRSSIERPRRCRPDGTCAATEAALFVVVVSTVVGLASFRVSRSRHGVSGVAQACYLRLPGAVRTSGAICVAGQAQPLVETCSVRVRRRHPRDLAAVPSADLGMEFSSRVSHDCCPQIGAIFGRRTIAGWPSATPVICRVAPGPGSHWRCCGRSVDSGRLPTCSRLAGARSSLTIRPGSPLRRVAVASMRRSAATP